MIPSRGTRVRARYTASIPVDVDAFRRGRRAPDRNLDQSTSSDRVRSVVRLSMRFIRGYPAAADRRGIAGLIPPECPRPRAESCNRARIPRCFAAGGYFRTSALKD